MKSQNQSKDGLLDGLIESAISGHVAPAPAVDDEELILDDRSEMRPAQMVENKLSGMLKGDGMMVSQLRLRSIIAGRS